MDHATCQVHMRYVVPYVVRRVESAGSASASSRTRMPDSGTRIGRTI
jgi:hypothetical protein